MVLVIITLHSKRNVLYFNGMIGGNTIVHIGRKGIMSGRHATNHSA